MSTELPPTSADALLPRERREQALAQRKRLALIMLAFAAVVFLVGTWLEMRHPHWAFGLMVAMAEAAMIGGLADWFAVVALFRHPLGQRWIPHTAIIPNKKDALGRALADFISDHFLEPSEVIRKVREFNPGARLATALADPVHAAKVGALVVNLAPHLLDLLDSERLHRFLHTITRDQLRRMDVSTMGSQVLGVLTHEGRHQVLLDSVLRDIDTVMADPATQDMIASRIGPQLWPVLRLTRLDQTVSDKMAAKMVAGVSDLIGEMARDPSHDLRVRFDGYVDDFVQRLKTDEVLRRKCADLRDRVLDDPALPAYIRGLWAEVLAWLRADLQRDDSEIARKASQGTRLIGEKLGADPAMQAWVNQWVETTVEPLVDKYRGSIRDFIVERVERWDTAQLVRELELSVGSDLQYIRYNGTAIGALIGGLLFAIVQGIAWLAA